MAPMFSGFCADVKDDCVGNSMATLNCSGFSHDPRSGAAPAEVRLRSRYADSRRYKHEKRGYLQSFLDTLARIMPYCTVRYAF